MMGENRCIVGCAKLSDQPMEVKPRVHAVSPSNPHPLVPDSSRFPDLAAQIPGFTADAWHPPGATAITN
jgi:hypothetical protein